MGDRMIQSVIRKSFIWMNQVLSYDMSKRIEVFVYRNLLKKDDYLHSYYIRRNKTNERYCIFRWNLPGIDLFSTAICYLFQYSQAKQKGMIPLIDLEYEWIYENGKLGIYNMWDWIFEQSVCIDEAVKKDYVFVEGMGSGYTYSSKVCKRINRDRTDRRIHITENNWKDYYKTANSCVKECWKVKPEILEWCKTFYRKTFLVNDRVLGVILKEDFTLSFYNETDRNYKKILEEHPCNPETDEIVRIVREKMERWNCNKIFLSTMYNESMALFKREFSDNVIAVERERIDLKGISQNSKRVQLDLSREENYKKFIDNIDYYRGRTEAYAHEVILLSMCNCFVAAHCSGAAAALTMNGGKYEQIFVLPDSRNIKEY